MKLTLATRVHSCPSQDPDLVIMRREMQAESATVLGSDAQAKARSGDFPATRRLHEAETAQLRSRECPRCGNRLTVMSGFSPPEQRLLCVNGCGAHWRDPDETGSDTRPKKRARQFEKAEALLDNGICAASQGGNPCGGELAETLNGGQVVCSKCGVVWRIPSDGRKWQLDAELIFPPEPNSFEEASGLASHFLREDSRLDDHLDADGVSRENASMPSSVDAGGRNPTPEPVIRGEGGKGAPVPGGPQELRTDSIAARNLRAWRRGR